MGDRLLKISCFVYPGSYSGAEVVWEANARLIAAAPEMLAALIKLELLARDLLLPIDGGTAERSGRLPREILAARDVIKKARGEE